MRDLSGKSLSEFTIEDWNEVGAGAFERAKKKAFEAGLPIASEFEGKLVWLFEDGHIEPYQPGVIPNRNLLSSK